MDADHSAFMPPSFQTASPCLYLLSKDSGGSAAPLVAALADAVIRAGIGAAEAQGGRVDPPVTVILDEAAAVATIADLPSWCPTPGPGPRVGMNAPGWNWTAPAVGVTHAMICGLRRQAAAARAVK